MDELQQRIMEQNAQTMKAMEMHDNSGLGVFARNTTTLSAMESYVKHSLGKKTGASFYAATKNGGIYQNTVVGNLITGSSPIDGFVPGLAKLKRGIASGVKIPFGTTGYGIQYLNPEALSGDDIKQFGTRNVDDVVVTGLGFGKDYTGFFGELSNSGFNQVKSATPYVQGSTDGASFALASSGKYFNKANLSSDFAEHISAMDVNDVNKLAAEFEKVTKTSLFGGKKFTQHAEDAAVLAAKMHDEAVAAVSKGAKYASHSQVKIANVARDEYVSAAKDVIVKNMSDDMAEHFTRLGPMQKLMNNPVARLMTGAYMGILPSLGVSVAAGLVSNASVTSQNNSVRDYTAARLTRHDPSLDVLSAESYIGSYQHSRLSESNDIDLEYASRNRNVAERHLADLSPLDININNDYKNFNIY